MIRRVLQIAALALAAAAPAAAQPQPGWMWMKDGEVFAGFNDQQRKFTDFTAWESQNWFMLTGDRDIAQGPGGNVGHVTVDGMLSLEPFTMHALGSPQVFQTGESYHGAPLIDYQHPHDLVMGLGASYRITREGLTYSLGAYVVGAPALGPTAFMHRESARDNPQVPLAHHMLDSTHITPGVVNGGVTFGNAMLEASVFNGTEPNDNHTNIDRPALNSWSARASWRGGTWHAQASGARIHDPETFEPYDVTRLTASIEINRTWLSKPLAATLAWGENREIHGNLDGYLAEWDWRVTHAGSFYGRAESVAKDILDLGSPSPPGIADFHRISHVDALTLGYVHDLTQGRIGRIGLGADATGYIISSDLQESYGAPHSFHVFVRWRPADDPMMTMMMPMTQ
jgi:hypothetical protein